MNHQHIGYMQKSAAINWSDISKGISDYWNGLSPETRKYLPYLLAGGAGALGGGLLTRRWGGALAGGLGGAGALALARWLMNRGQTPAASPAPSAPAPETDYGMGAVRQELGLTPAAKPTPEEIRAAEQAKIRAQYSPEAGAAVEAAAKAEKGKGAAATKSGDDKGIKDLADRSLAEGMEAETQQRDEAEANTREAARTAIAEAQKKQNERNVKAAQTVLGK